MLAYARNEFELDLTEEGGHSLRAHLVSVERNTRRTVDKLHIECPAGARHIWAWFMELCKGRQVGPHGPLLIPYSEILAWATLTGTAITSHEVAIIKAVDMLFIGATREANG